ncbi:serine/threonine-protein kinase Nek4 [Pyxicephalus adspersus]|uniref:serine/threonine-protein kinase Nek4 n=1 Tax=Pyxicephalus adspersus TaxID=30357 RepID=UPI003B5B5678
MEEQRQRAGLEDYRIIRVVGKGSYGEVSLASHRAEGKQYVIKKLNLRNAPRRERKAAEQEAQLLSKLKHPNIVAYKESWEGGDGLLYIVMGYCEGGDLYHKLKDQKAKLLPESQVVEWFVQIAMALQYLHDLHIMHRDLKTQNIFLTKSNIIKVGDLGIARVLESQYDMASTLIGTPYYMSPELFSNKPYNYKSDVWALGCCVYEMATLKHAFNAKDMNSLVYRIIEGKLPPMPRDYSSDLGDLIGTMLSRQPEKRPTVRQILRKPYIKEHIALFLQHSKLKQGRRKKKVVDSSSVPKNPEQEVQPQPAPDHAKEHKVSKARSPVKMKAANIPPPAPEPVNNMAVSISSLSKVVIDIVPGDKRQPHDEHLISQPENGCISRDVACKVIRNGPRGQDSQTKPQPALGSKMENKIPSVSLEDEEDTMKLLQPVAKCEEKITEDVIPVHDVLESTEKLLEPFVAVAEPDGHILSSEIHPRTSKSEPSLSKQRKHRIREKSADSDKANVQCPRPLPSPPAIQPQDVTKCSKSPERKFLAADHVDSSKSSAAFSQDHRPLSARERRRLKQSQEEISLSAPSVRKSSTNAVVKPEEINPVNQMQSMSEKKKQTPVWQTSEDDLSSSTSSTDRSEGECKERKSSDSGDMNDLVDLMTQTLHMEKDKSQPSPAPCREFKFHRKYRDTLMLHGRGDEAEEDLFFPDVPSDNLTVPQKFRRMIEALRADVVKGLGVKVLEQVYDVMDEKDDRQKELRLQKILGEKYDDYNLKVQQLKFFEENSKF